MKMIDPVPTFSYLVKQLAERHSTLGYIHVIEPRMHGATDHGAVEGEVRLMCMPNLPPLTSIQSNDFVREIWRPLPLISAGGYNRETAIDTAEQKGDLIAFGRFYIPNVRASLCLL
jgi:NADPH2 dehydrogenase